MELNHDSTADAIRLRDIVANLFAVLIFLLCWRSKTFGLALCLLSLCGQASTTFGRLLPGLPFLRPCVGNSYIWGAGGCHRGFGRNRPFGQRCSTTMASHYPSCA